MDDIAKYKTWLSASAKEYYNSIDLYQKKVHKEIDLTAFISSYNEAKFINETLTDVSRALQELRLNYEILIIDDNSSDASVEVILSFIDSHPEIPIVFRHNLFRNGLAQNYIDAAFIGHGRYYKLFCGDNTEPVESIKEICNLIGRADIILPNYINVVGRGLFRRLLSRSYTALVNLISGNHVKYYNGLPVHLRFNIMRWHPNTRGFGFQADIICMLLAQGVSYIEISVPAVDKSPSRALNIKNLLSVVHTLLDIAVKRLANFIYSHR